MTPRRRAVVLTGLALAFAGPPALIAARLAGWLTADPLVQRVGVSCGMIGLALAVVLLTRFGEGLPLASLGLRRPGWGTLGWGLGVGLLAILAYPLFLMFAKGAGLSAPAPDGFDVLLGLPLWARVTVLINAAIAEEVLFRGYAITRLTDLSGSLQVAVLISLAVFVVLHLTWGSAAMLVPVAAVGAMLSVLFVARRDLLSAVLAHLVLDSVPLLVLPALGR